MLSKPPTSFHSRSLSLSLSLFLCLSPVEHLKKNSERKTLFTLLFHCSPSLCSLSHSLSPSLYHSLSFTMTEAARNPSADDVSMMRYLLDELQPSLLSNKKSALASFEKYFFKKRPMYTHEQVVELIRGSKGRKGLLFSCGQLSKKTFKLKKSAAKALMLLWKLLDTQTNPDAKVYRLVLVQSERKLLAGMRLGKHDQAALGSSNSARRILRLIKERESMVDLTAAEEEETKNGTEETSMLNEDARNNLNKKIGHRPSKSTVHRMGIARSDSEMNAKKGRFSKAWELLTGFFRSRPPASALQQKGVLKTGQYFGALLSTVPKSALFPGVPILVVDAISRLRKTSMRTHGLFRVSGNATFIQKLKKAYDYEEKVDLEEVDEHTVSGLLKLYFREMGEPLIPFDKYEAVVDAIREEQFHLVDSIMADLPEENRQTLSFLLDYLADVSGYQEENLMSPGNLAIVFSPNLLRPAVETYIAVARDTPFTIAFMKHLIENRINSRPHPEPVEHEPSVLDETPHDDVAVQQKENVPWPWVEYTDPASLTVYYYNQETHETQWELPDKEETAALAAAAKHGNGEMQTEEMGEDEELEGRERGLTSELEGNSLFGSLPLDMFSLPTSEPIVFAGSFNNSQDLSSTFSSDRRDSTIGDHIGGVVEEEEENTNMAPPPLSLKEKEKDEEEEEAEEDIPPPPPAFNENDIEPVSTCTTNTTTTTTAMSDTTGSFTSSTPTPSSPSLPPQSATHDEDTKGDANRPLPPFWSRHEDVSTGKIFYHNANTNESSWTFPEISGSVLPPKPILDVARKGSVTTRTTTDGQLTDCVSEFVGKWEGKRSGGCHPNYVSWRENPQFHLEVDASSTGEREINIAGTITLTSGVGPGKKSPAVGFYVFKNKERYTQKLFVSDVDHIARSEFVLTNETTCSFTVQVGVSYILMPCTFHPSFEGDFKVELRASARLTVAELEERERWDECVKKGRWEGKSAGGCRNHETWEHNPQYLVSLALDAPSSIPTVLILSQPPAVEEMFAIGFYVINKAGDIVGKAPFMHAPEVHFRADLSPSMSPYLIVPCTFSPGQEQSYQLSCFSQHDIKLIETE